MTEPLHSKDSEERHFKRELGLMDSTMIVIGSMIGSGIFIVSADIARTVGGGGYLILVWVITGLITMIAALSYGELAVMMPHAGGQYVYLREAFGPLVGFLYGWTLFFVIQTGTIAAVAVAFAKFTSVLIPAVGDMNVLFSVEGHNVTAAQLFAIASIVLLTWVNSLGVRAGKLVQGIFTTTKTLALLGLILLGLIVGSNHTIIAQNLSRFWDASWTHVDGGKIVGVTSLSGLMLLAAMGVASVGSLFSSDAWNNITFTAGEVINPKRNIPLSLILGTGTVTVLYLLANVAYISSLPTAGNPDAVDVIGRGIQFASSDRVGVAAATRIFGDIAGIVMAVMIMVSTFGCNNGLILAGARVYYAMAKDKLFFRKAADLNSRSVPGYALVAQGIWASVLCLSGKYNDLLNYVIFAVLIFYCLTIAGIFVLRKKRPDAERPYKALGYPIVPGLYIILAAAICIDLLIFTPDYTWPGLIIVLIGVPVFYMWRRAGSAEA